MLQWSWQGDNKAFVPYDAASNLKIEQAHQLGVVEHPLDAERFLDFKTSFQRRRDDPSKRRAVQREPGLLFANKILVLGPDVERRAELLTHIAGCEDTLVLKRVHKQVDFVVVQEQWIGNAAARALVMQATGHNVPVVTEATLLRALAEGKWPPSGFCEVDTSGLLADARRQRDEDEKAKAAKAKTAAAAVSAGKRSREDIEEEEEQREEERKKPDSPAPAKVAKASTAGTAGASPVKAVATAPAALAPISKIDTVYSAPSVSSKAASEEESDTTPKLDQDGALSTFGSGSEWTGAVDEVPFFLAVSVVDGLSFSGIVTYPTLGMAKVRVRGRFKGGLQCEYTEESALAGDDFVVLGSTYQIKFANELAGEGSYAALDGSAGKVALRLARPPPPAPLALPFPATLQGFVLVPEPVHIALAAVDDKTVSGTFRRGTGAAVPFTAARSGNEFLCDQFLCQLSPEGYGSGLVFAKGQNSIFFVRE